MQIVQVPGQPQMRKWVDLSVVDSRPYSRNRNRSRRRRGRPPGAATYQPPPLLTAEQADLIRERHGTGLTYRQLQREAPGLVGSSVSLRTIWKVLNRKSPYDHGGPGA